MCRVEREGGPKPVAGCTRPVTGGRKDQFEQKESNENGQDKREKKAWVG